MKTKTIRAADLWPGMIIVGPGRFNDHSHRGRIADISAGATIPWDENACTLRVFFNDEFEGMSQ